MLVEDIEKQDEVAKYLEEVSRQDRTYKGRLSERYKEYLAMSHFALYGYHIIDKEKYIIDKNNNDIFYNLRNKDIKIEFSRVSDYLSIEKEKLLNKEEATILTDDEYDRLDFLLDQIDRLRLYTNRTRCHELTFKYAKDYNCKAVTGLLYPKNMKLTLYHSWLENDNYVLDITNDLMFKKATFNRYVIEKINEIDYDKLKEYGDEINGYFTLLYLAAKKKLNLHK